MEYPCVLLVVMVAAGAAMVHGHPAASTPAARFWEQALPGSPMPEAMADLIQKGIDHSPLVQHYSAVPSVSICGIWNNACSWSLAEGTGIFFHEAQLRPGSTMTVSFPAEVEPPLLPRDVAQKVPFGDLGAVLAAFGVPPGSAEAAAVAATLAMCRSATHAGDLKSCTTSLEDTVQSAKQMLLGDSAAAADDVVWGATSVLPRAGLPRQQYVVEAVAPLAGGRYVACHKVPFSYRVYQCHMTTRSSDKAYVLSIRGLSGGAAADMVAFCHRNTADWTPTHAAFEVLRTSPGIPVCHFLTYANPVFGIKAS